MEARLTGARNDSNVSGESGGVPKPRRIANPGEDARRRERAQAVDRGEEGSEGNALDTALDVSGDPPEVVAKAI